MPKALLVEILADANQFGRELDRAAGKTRAMSKVAGVAGLALAGGLAYGLEKSVKAASQFQASMELIHTQAGASTEEVKRMSAAVLVLAGKVGTAPDELAAGLFHIESAGLRGAKALAALKVAAEGAKVGQANLEDVTNALNATIVSGIKGSKNFTAAMGSLNATVGAGDMRMQDLAEAMGTGLLASAKVAGVSLNQVNAALAVLGDNNIRGAKAGTLLTSTLRVLGHQSTAGAAALASMGINSDTLQKKLGSSGLTGALDYLKARLDATKVPLYQVRSNLSEAFGGKQATGIKILLGQLERLHGKLRDVAAGAGRFGNDWKAYSKTAQAANDRFHASLQAVEISIGDALLPALAGLTSSVAGVTEWFAKHQAVARDLVAALAAVAATMLAVSVATKVVRTAVTLWAAVTKLVTAAQWALNIALDANPIGVVVIAIAALTAAFVYAYEHSRTFRNIVLMTWHDIKDVTMAVVNFLKPVIKVLIDGWIAEFRIARAIALHLWDGIKASWDSQFGGAVRDIIVVVKELIGWLERAIGLIQKAANAANSLMNPMGKGHKIAPGKPPVAPPGTKGFATGGIVTSPTFAMVGEAGPEAIIPLGSSKANGMLGGAGMTVNVGPVYGSVDDDFAQRLSSSLAKQLRAGAAPALQQAIHNI